MDFFKLIKKIKSGQIDKLYLFFGNEYFLIRETIIYIKKTLLCNEFNDVNYNNIEGKEAKLEDLLCSAKTMPFFSNKRLIVVNNYLGIINNKKEEDLFLRFIQNLPDHLCLILVSPQIDKRKKIYKSILKNGKVIEFKPFKGNLLIRWIEQRFSLEGKQIDKGAAIFLANNFDKGLEELNSEINKLITYSGGKEFIEQSDILPIVRTKLENNIFLLMDAIGKKNSENALSILNDIIKEGEAPLWILFMIIRQLRLIYRSLMLLQRGINFNEIQKAINVHPYALKKAIEQGNNFNITKINKALNLALDIDLKIKRGSMEPKIAVEILVIIISSIL